MVYGTSSGPQDDIGDSLGRELLGYIEVYGYIGCGD